MAKIDSNDGSETEEDEGGVTQPEPLLKWTSDVLEPEYVGLRWRVVRQSGTRKFKHTD
ncbi:hypothetical protein L804_05576 [Cryptococcus deuterogattii 2001/935-1]|nr:hypothetical protein L804_05576 [Cryptococcus deuterogattii 2001/935-1]